MDTIIDLKKLWLEQNTENEEVEESKKQKKSLGVSYKCFKKILRSKLDGKIGEC